MDQVIDLLQTSLQSSDQDLKQILSSFAEHKVFMRKSSKVECVVAQINNLLNPNGDYPKGLLLLHTFLPQCSPLVFADHGFFWMQQCLKSAEQDDAVAILELQTLSELFKISADFIDLRKNVINTLLPKFFDKLDGKGSNEIRAAKMKCLVNVMSYYAGACGLRRGIVDKFIQKALKVISVDDKEWLADTCKCYLLLAQCGGSGSQGFVHKGNWSQQFQTLINTAHSLLDSLFDSVTEIQVSKTSSDGSADKKLSVLESIPSFENPVARYNTYSSLFCKTMKLVQAMLLGSFPAPKSVTPVALFNVICRGLAVNCSTISKKSLTLDKIALISVIPFVHVELLNTLDALIKCCGRNLIPYASFICKLSCQSLKWTAEEWEYSLEKPYKSVRIATYRVLQSWLNSARLSSGVEHFINELLELLENDFKYDKPSIKLQNKNQADDRKGKRKKHVYAQESDIERKDFTKSSCVTCNKDICYQALHTLQLILQSACGSISVAQQIDLQTSIVKLLLDINQSSNKTAPIPYSDVTCRLQLYRTLHFLVMESHSDGCPPTPYATLIFTRGLLDASQQISSFCAEALSSIEKIIHPMCRSLYFPNEAPIDCGEALARENIAQNANLESTPKQPYLSTDSEISERNLSRSHNLTGNALSDVSNFSLEVNLSSSNPKETVVDDLGDSMSHKESLQDTSTETDMSECNNSPKVILVDNSSSSSSSCSISSVVEIPSKERNDWSVVKNERIVSSATAPEQELPEGEDISVLEPPQKKLKTNPSETGKSNECVETASNDGEIEEMLADFVDIVN